MALRLGPRPPPAKTQQQKRPRRPGLKQTPCTHERGAVATIGLYKHAPSKLNRALATWQRDNRDDTQPG